MVAELISKRLPNPRPSLATFGIYLAGQHGRLLLQLLQPLQNLQPGQVDLELLGVERIRRLGLAALLLRLGPALLQNRHDDGAGGRKPYGGHR